MTMIVNADKLINRSAMLAGLFWYCLPLAAPRCCAGAKKQKQKNEGGCRSNSSR